MRAFSQLLDDLVYTRSRISKLRLIGEYLKATPDPDRGLALAALTGTLDIKAVKPAQVRAMAMERIDPVLLARMLDHLDISGRFALIKLATGALRVGISARLAKQAFADAFGLDVEAVEEIWHGLKPPYRELFEW